MCNINCVWAMCNNRSKHFVVLCNRLNETTALKYKMANISQLRIVHKMFYAQWNDTVIVCWMPVIAFQANENEGISEVRGLFSENTQNTQATNDFSLLFCIIFLVYFFTRYKYHSEWTPTTKNNMEFLLYYRFGDTWHRARFCQVSTNYE